MGKKKSQKKNKSRNSSGSKEKHVESKIALLRYKLNYELYLFTVLGHNCSRSALYYLYEWKTIR